MLLVTIVPPFNTMYYDNSAGVIKSRPAICYEFLFTNSWKEINYQRLFLEYLIILIISRWLILSQRKASASLATRVTELSITNDRLMDVITKGKHTGELLKQKALELTAEKERLSSQINELKDAELKWHAYKNQLEQNLNEQSDEVSRAKEQIEKQIAERKQLEDCLEKQNNELNSVGERLKNQMAKLEAAEDCFKKQADELSAVQHAERQLREYNRQLEQRVEKRNAELSAVNKQLEEELSENNEEEKCISHGLDSNKLRTGESRKKSELFNVEEMKAIAELAKRLAKK